MRRVVDFPRTGFSSRMMTPHLKIDVLPARLVVPSNAAITGQQSRGWLGPQPTEDSHR